MKTRQFFLPSFWSRSITMTRLAHADLDGGQADALGGIHAVGHVFGQLADLRIHLFDRGGDGFQARIGRDKDRADGHGREIRRRGAGRVKD